MVEKSENILIKVGGDDRALVIRGNMGTFLEFMQAMKKLHGGAAGFDWTPFLISQGITPPTPPMPSMRKGGEE